MHAGADRLDVEAPLTGVARSLLTEALVTNTRTQTVHSDRTEVDTDRYTGVNADTWITPTGGTTAFASAAAEYAAGRCAVACPSSQGYCAGTGGCVVADAGAYRPAPDTPGG